MPLSEHKAAMDRIPAKPTQQDVDRINGELIDVQQQLLLFKQREELRKELATHRTRIASETANADDCISKIKGITKQLNTYNS